jgi:natural product precursor
MKKLKLKALELGAMEVLSRSQLKNILGGSDENGSGSESNIQCHYTISNGTESFEASGSCASSDVSACASYASAACQTAASQAGSDWSCVQTACQ